MIIISKEPLTPQQLEQVTQAFGNYIKIVVDVEQGILAGGGKLHADCEEALLEEGSRQENLWGGGVDLINKDVEYNSLTNIRPKDNNPSQEILDPKIRVQFEKIVRRTFKL